jgi:hypothetical protein
MFVFHVFGAPMKRAYLTLKKAYSLCGPRQGMTTFLAMHLILQNISNLL